VRRRRWSQEPRWEAGSTLVRREPAFAASRCACTTRSWADADAAEVNGGQTARRRRLMKRCALVGMSRNDIWTLQMLLCILHSCLGMCTQQILFSVSVHLLILSLIGDAHRTSARPYVVLNHAYPMNQHKVHWCSMSVT
jgi:hypothetical protein